MTHDRNSGQRLAAEQRGPGRGKRAPVVAPARLQNMRGAEDQRRPVSAARLRPGPERLPHVSSLGNASHDCFVQRRSFRPTMGHRIARRPVPAACDPGFQTPFGQVRNLSLGIELVQPVRGRHRLGKQRAEPADQGKPGQLRRRRRARCNAFGQRRRQGKPKSLHRNGDGIVHFFLLSYRLLGRGSAEDEGPHDALARLDPDVRRAGIAPAFQRRRQGLDAVAVGQRGEILFGTKHRFCHWLDNGSPPRPAQCHIGRVMPPRPPGPQRAEIPPG